jgi:hypothetical protein
MLSGKSGERNMAASKVRDPTDSSGRDSIRQPVDVVSPGAMVPTPRLIGHIKMPKPATRR